jgi:exopolyphosphatase/guanosine-5'-triphosphate,3'-diphosphate pyrophosphatase
MPYTKMFATVDLGSNSFRLQICREYDGQLQVVDSIKEMVRFAAGLDEDKNIIPLAAERALNCLAKFGERLRGIPEEQVRAVATNTFRIAKNIGSFLPEAEKALGFPIEVIAGREEARLIYLGVKHTLPLNNKSMLVIDIGGGSTEFVIGQELQPDVTESLNLGCVSYSLRYFPNQKITHEQFDTAINAARSEIQRITPYLKNHGWDFAVGTSGTARSIRDIIATQYEDDDTITLSRMREIRNRIINEGGVRKAKLLGLKADRIEVFAGGLAVMIAAFEELSIETMSVTDAALRDGVLYDLIGRGLDSDMRGETVKQFQERYHADEKQAARVESIAIQCMNGLKDQFDAEDFLDWCQFVRWAARLHEIGLSIAHTGYHKHSAYIIENADMPGFSKQEQSLLSKLVLGHRGDTKKLMDIQHKNNYMFAILSLRIAALFCRGRKEIYFPDNTTLQFNATRKKCILTISSQWLEENPLTTSALILEAAQWSKIGQILTVKRIEP